MKIAKGKQSFLKKGQLCMYVLATPPIPSGIVRIERGVVLLLPAVLRKPPLPPRELLSSNNTTVKLPWGHLVGPSKLFNRPFLSQLLKLPPDPSPPTARMVIFGKVLCSTASVLPLRPPPPVSFTDSPCVTAIVLLLNAICVLSEDRFLARGMAEPSRHSPCRCLL